jgi:tRNA A37 N6-isopentenylltransferase MiaA
MRYAKRQMTWFRHQEDVRWFAERRTRAARILDWLG